MLPAIKHTILTSVRQLFALRGYQIRKVTPVDKRGEKVRHAVRERFLPRPVLVNVPVERCRGLYWFRLEPEYHPFVAALNDYKEGRCTSYRDSPLETFHRNRQPRRATDVLGLSDAQAPGFQRVPAAGYCMPWSPAHPGGNVRARRTIAQEEAKQYKVSLEQANGMNLIGSVSHQKGELEFRRLTQLYHSIKQAGYHRHEGEDGDIEGKLLIDRDNNWSLQIHRGHHRIAAVAALGYSVLPIRIRHAPIRELDIECWPQVKSGSMTRNGALSVFHRVMAGEPPPVYCWNDHFYEFA